MATALTHTSLPKLTRIAQGKVRDIYALPDEQDADKLLFVATDRISAFDIIMENVSVAVTHLSPHLTDHLPATTPRESQEKALSSLSSPSSGFKSYSTSSHITL